MLGKARQTLVVIVVPLACASPYSSAYWIRAEDSAANTQDWEFSKEQCLERLNQSQKVLSEDGATDTSLALLTGLFGTDEFKSCMEEYGWVPKKQP